MSLGKVLRKLPLWAKILIPAVLVAVGVVAFLYTAKYTKYFTAMEEMTFSTVNLSEIPDGVYLGECDTSVLYARVEVEMEGGTLIGIRLLEHRQERGEAAERLPDDMVRAQSLQVDAVAGATNSSKVIRKAVENALLGGVEPE